MIIAMPDVRTIDIRPENGDFVVLGCRVIWNTMSSQNMGYFVSNRIRILENKLSMICEEVRTFNILIYLFRQYSLIFNIYLSTY